MTRSSSFELTTGTRHSGFCRLVGVLRHGPEIYVACCYYIHEPSLGMHEVLLHDRKLRAGLHDLADDASAPITQEHTQKHNFLQASSAARLSMWFLDATTRQPIWFTKPPTGAIEDGNGLRDSYAILSHTWGNREVTLIDVQKPAAAREQEEFRKVHFICEEAIRCKLRYAWVDTCCIDKSSSAELSEAINSMFSWYHQSAICFVYLEDFVCAGNAIITSDKSLDLQAVTQSFAHEDRARLARCKWFTRGWTLQELIAPQKVCFFDQLWRPIGDRSGLLNDLVHITGIERVVLDRKETDPPGHLPSLLKQMSLAKRLSWAAGRETTRPEDRAYSLLGLFNVTIPLLYGEGDRAFARLQEIIVETTTDQSILLGDEGAENSVWSLRPHAFRNLSRVMALPCSKARLYESQKNGIRIRLPIVSVDTPVRTYAVLNCRYEDDFSGRIGIEVKIRPEEKRVIGGKRDDSMMAWLIRSERPRTFSDDVMKNAVTQTIVIVADHKEFDEAAPPESTYVSRIMSLWFQPNINFRDHFASVEAVPSENWNKETNVMQWRQEEHGALPVGRVTWHDSQRNSWLSIVYRFEPWREYNERIQCYTFKLKHSHERPEGTHGTTPGAPTDRKHVPTSWMRGGLGVLELQVQDLHFTIKAEFHERRIMGMLVCIVKLRWLAMPPVMRALRSLSERDKSEAMLRDTGHTDISSGVSRSS